MDRTFTLNLAPKYLQQVMEILQKHLSGKEVWAYGSRVNGDCYDASDLDLVVRQPKQLNEPLPNLGTVREAFSNSQLPIFVQIVDWAMIPFAFRDEIEAAYVVIQKA